MEFRTGQIVKLRSKGRDLDAIVCDPNGIGPGKPTIGLGFRGMGKHTSVPNNTLTQRVLQNEEGRFLKLPSGKLFRVLQIDAEDGNQYSVIEAADWANLAKDWAKNPGKLRKPARDGLIEFLAWFAAEGIYAQAYAILNAVYTREDSEQIQQWLLSRETGKPYRIEWSWEVSQKDSRKRFGKWTNYLYRGLFGMDAAEIKEHWAEPVRGSRRVARNFIPQPIGLEAIAYCEKMVAQLDFDDVQLAHDEAIRLTKIKYRRYFPKDN